MLLERKDDGLDTVRGILNALVLGVLLGVAMASAVIVWAVLH